MKSLLNRKSLLLLAYPPQVETKPVSISGKKPRKLEYVDSLGRSWKWSEEEQKYKYQRKGGGRRTLKATNVLPPGSLRLPKNYTLKDLDRVLHLAIYGTAE